MSAITRHLPTVARVLFGLVFFVFGLNGFLSFLPMPEHPGASGAFLSALAATGYMFPLIKGTEVVVGLALLSNRFVPLALVVLAPVMVNIVLFHAVLDPAGVAMPVVLLALHLYLAWAYRGSFRGLLQAKTSPAAAESAPVTEAAAA